MITADAPQQVQAIRSTSGQSNLASLLVFPVILVWVGVVGLTALAGGRTALRELSSRI